MGAVEEEDEMETRGKEETKWKGGDDEESNGKNDTVKLSFELIAFRTLLYFLPPL